MATLGTKPPGPGGPIKAPGAGIRGQGQLLATAKDLDPARYILKPDTDFKRPTISNVGGNAFIWPLGTEQFELNSNAALGIHHYIGDNDVDVTVIYPVEEHIVISGLFPGYTGSANMAALRQVLTEKAPDGRILNLPNLYNGYVEISSYRFSHDTNDRTSGIGYSMECIQVAAGRKVPPLQSTSNGKGGSIKPPTPATPKGTNSNTYTTSQGVRTLKTIASAVYNNPDLWTRIRDLNKVTLNNLTTLNTLPVSPYQLPIVQLPIGLKLAV